MPPSTHQLRPVFLFSPGRSGSTLLQRFLNASPDLLMWGEHGGIITGVANAYRAFLDDSHSQRMLAIGRRHAASLIDKIPAVGRDIEWANAFTLDTLRNAFRSFMLALFASDVPPGVRWGFKEIRYTEREFAFLQEIFPESQLVFIVREPMAALASMLYAWAKLPATDEWSLDDPAMRETVTSELKRLSKHLTRALGGLRAWAAQGGEGYLVRYEDLTRNPEHILQKLFIHLGAAVPPPDVIAQIRNDIRAQTPSAALAAALSQSTDFQEVLAEPLGIYADLPAPGPLPAAR